MLTRSGIVAALTAAICLAGGIATGYGFLVGIGLAVIAILALGALWAIQQPSLQASQFLVPAVIEEGDAASSMVTVVNNGRRSTAPLFIENHLAGEPLSVNVAPLPKHERRKVVLPLEVERRGLYELGPLSVDATGPFSFVRVGVLEATTLHLTVTPRTHQMSTLPTGHRRELEGVGARPQEGGVAFHSLREYVPGDDLRLIHWRSLARTGELMVRRNTITSEPRLLVVLDTDSASYARSFRPNGEPADFNRDQFEDAVRIAASLAKAGAESHYPTMLRTTSGHLAATSADGSGLHDIMQLLARIDAAPNDPGVGALVGFGDRAEGVSVGIVSGQPLPNKVSGAINARSVFDMVTVIQVGDDITPVHIAGALTVTGPTSEEVARKWRSMFN